MDRASPEMSDNYAADVDLRPNRRRGWTMERLLSLMSLLSQCLLFDAKTAKSATKIATFPNTFWWQSST